MTPEMKRRAVLAVLIVVAFIGGWSSGPDRVGLRIAFGVLGAAVIVWAIRKGERARRRGNS